MGRLIYSMSVSLDGFAATKDHSLDWVHVDEELHEVFNEEARRVGTFLYGRRMWELMSDYWPTGDTGPRRDPGGARLRPHLARQAQGRLLEHRSTMSTGTPAWSARTLWPKSPG